MSKPSDVARAGAHLHAVFLGDSANVVGSGNGTNNRSLLLVIGKTFSGEVRAAPLRDLDDDRRLDIPVAQLRSCMTIW